jgi:pimeloyl-ACP methyl ester carboxylesterase
MGSIVLATTQDGLLLQGYLSNNSTDTVLLHIHGYEGNFYENTFVQSIAGVLESNGISFLSVNTRGCEKIKMFNTTGGDYRTIGARYELLEEAYLDIDAWIEELLKKGYSNIILSGHSLGTMKVIRYMYEGKYRQKISKLILLSPFDKKALLQSQTDRTIEEMISYAQNQVALGNGDEMVEFEIEDVFSYNTFLSWYSQDALGRAFEFSSPDYEFPSLSNLSVPTKVIVGSKDEYFHLSNPDHPEEALEILNKFIPNCETFLIEGAGHGYSGYETVLSDAVLDFISR